MFFGATLVVFLSAQALGDTPFACKDGSQVTAFLNDDYCDCPDGSDEPKTSACVGGDQFQCLGDHRALPRSIPKSFVGDGVCDCPDGSDEPENTCEDKTEQIIAERKEWLEKELEVVRAGWEARQKLREEGRKARRSHGKLTETIRKQGAAMQESLMQFQQEGRMQEANSLVGQLREMGGTLQHLESLKSLALKGDIVEWNALEKSCFRVVVNEKILRGGSPIPGKYEDYAFELCPLRFFAQWQHNAETTPELPEPVVETHWPQPQHTILGVFTRLDATNRSQSLYSEGGPCPNGINRKVELHGKCGVESLLESVWEDGMCEYGAVFVSPLFCEESVLLDLERMLVEIRGVQLKEEL